MTKKPSSIHGTRINFSRQFPADFPRFFPCRGISEFSHHFPSGKIWGIHEEEPRYFPSIFPAGKPTDTTNFPIFPSPLSGGGKGKRENGGGETGFPCLREARFMDQDLTEHMKTMLAHASFIKRTRCATLGMDPYEKQIFTCRRCNAEYSCYASKSPIGDNWAPCEYNIVCPDCKKLFPPALLKAVMDYFDAAVGLRDGTIIRFCTAQIHGDFIHLDLGSADSGGMDQLPGRCPYPFRRGVDVRLSDIVWCADAPEGS
jgi:hypothetical protein